MKIILAGYGKMGHMIEELALARGWQVLAALDDGDFHRLSSFEKADVLLDFSHPDNLPAIADYIRRTGTALVSGTTGYGEKEREVLRDLGQAAPILHSANYSLGIALFRRILETFGESMLADFEPEMTETHHRQKADAPSGTAKMLADALDPAGSLRRVSGREGFVGARKEDEMGIFSLRGGTEAGTHTLYLFGEDETLSITHSAASRRIFAAGAVKAAAALSIKPAGFYSLDQILFAPKA